MFMNKEKGKATAFVGYIYMTFKREQKRNLSQNRKEMSVLDCPCDPKAK